MSDSQTEDLLAALAERNIYSRADLLRWAGGIRDAFYRLGGDDALKRSRRPDPGPVLCPYCLATSGRHALGCRDGGAA